MEKKLFLLDAYALIYRAYFAFINNPRYSSKGLNTSAIFGFVMALDDILKKEKPTHIAVAFDLSGPTFRHDMFADYKGHRAPTPEPIKTAIPYIRQIIAAYNIPILESVGFEADDVIGTLAKKAGNAGYQVFMVTPDKDYCQLVSENIFIYKPKRSGNEVEIWGVKEVCADFQVDNPLKVIDVLALWGDVADNVPGAPGIGEVTAKKLIREWGSVEKLISNGSMLKGKIKEAVTTHKAQVLLSKQLVTISLDVPVELDEEALLLKDMNRPILTQLFEELEFRNLMTRVLPKPETDNSATLFELPNASAKAETSTEITDNSGYKTIKDVEHTYHLVDNELFISKLIEDLYQQTEFCFDTETTGLDVHSAELVGMSFAWNSGEAYYVPAPENQKDAQVLVDRFKPIFESEQISKIGQNCKFDVLMLSRYGVQVKGKLFDTMLAHYLLEPDQPHNMNYLAETYLGYRRVPIEQLIGKSGKDQKTMRSVSYSEICEYAAEDADVTLQLKIILKEKLEQANLLELAETIEMPLLTVLADMENAGVRLDIEILSDYAKDLNGRLMIVEMDIKELAGVDFNIGSPKQLGEILFERLKIVDDPKMTKTKQYSTSE